MTSKCLCYSGDIATIYIFTLIYKVVDIYICNKLWANSNFAYCRNS